MRKYLIFFAVSALIFCPEQTIGDDCETLSKKALYQYSDLIFIGKLTHEYDNYYLVSVQETLKGKVDSIIKIGKKNAPMLTRSKFWLVYATYREDKITISPCSGTKSFTAPFGTHDLNKIEMPPEVIMNNEILSYFNDTDFFYSALNELQLEIMTLRLFKLEKELVNQRLENKNLIDQVNWYYKAILGLLGFLILLQLFIGLKRPPER